MATNPLQNYLMPGYQSPSQIYNKQQTAPNNMSAMNYTYGSSTPTLNKNLSTVSTPNTPSTPPPTSGGGNNGGMSIREQMEKGLIPWDDNILNKGDGQGPSLESQVNDLFNPSFDYLNQAESNLTSDYGGVQSGINSNFDLNSSLLGNSKTEGLANLDTSAINAGSYKEDALSSARRLYDQLRRGYQQRFGGSTSAGGAASEIASAEQQRQMGGISRDYGTAMRAIDLGRNKIESDYKTGVMQLTYQKQQALTQAQSDYHSKLLEIANNKSQLQTAKAQASLNLLQDYRNKVFSIQQTNQNLANNLTLMREQSNLNLQNYQATVGQAQQSGTSAYDTFINNNTTTPTSNLQANGIGQNTQSPYVGQVGRTIKGYDPVTGQPIYS